MLKIDKYSHINNIADKNPMVKCIFAMVVLFLGLIIEKQVIYGITFLCMSALILFLAKIPFKYYLKLLMLPATFVMMSLIVILFQITKDKNLMLVSINVFGKFIGVTQKSLDTSLEILIRSMSSVSCVYFLSLTTSINQIAIVFKKMRVPSVFTELFVLSYRFIFIFLEESMAIYRSQELRFGYRGIKNGYKSISMLIAILFRRVLERYKKMETSLDARLYNGSFHY